MPRPPPKKHAVKAPAAIWKPGDPRQAVDKVNQDAPTQTLSVTVAGSATVAVPHSLGRMPRFAWVTKGEPKVTVTGATETTVTLTNSDPGPQEAQVALS